MYSWSLSYNTWPLNYTLVGSFTALTSCVLLGVTFLWSEKQAAALATAQRLHSSPEDGDGVEMNEIALQASEEDEERIDHVEIIQNGEKEKNHAGEIADTAQSETAEEAHNECVTADAA